MLLSVSAVAQAPGCASNPSPTDAQVDIPAGPITLTWDAVDGVVDGYDLYVGLTPDDLEYFSTYTINSTEDDLQVSDYNLTIYWSIVAYNEEGEAMGCSVWSFTTGASPGYCLTDTYGQYPFSTYTPETCDGVTENEITDAGYAGEYSEVNVVSGESYTFKSGTSDFITISTDEGATAAAYGATPLTWTSTVSGVIRFYSHVDDQCGSEDEERIRSIVCGTISTDSPDYVSLQWPPNGTVDAGGSLTVYGQVYEGGLTDVEPGLSGQADGIQAWVGTNSDNTDPATWPSSAWKVAAFNPSSTGNNDEYMADIGSDLAPGTHYYATRFRLNNGAYVYGGIDASNNGNFWNGTTHNSGVLTVDSLANDECSGAVALTVGEDFESEAITGTNIGATDDALIPECQEDVAQNVWFSVVVPASGNVTIETAEVDGSDFGDSIVVVYSGDCNNLLEIGCDDDTTGTFSTVEITGRTEGEVLYVSVWSYNSFFGPELGAFKISAYDEALSTGEFGLDKLSYYPNPVKDKLNLSSPNIDITKVQVYNVMGQLVVDQSGSSIKDVNMSSLSAGTYIVKAIADKEVKTIKVVKS